MAQIKFQVEGSQLRIMPISTELTPVMVYEYDAKGEGRRTGEVETMADGRATYRLSQAKVAVGEQVYGVAKVLTATDALPAAADAFAALYTGSGRANVTISGGKGPYELLVTVEVPDLTVPGTKRASE